MLSSEALKQFVAYYNFKVKGRQVKNYASWLRQFFISLNNPEIESIHLGQILQHLQLTRDFGLDEKTIYSKCLAMRQFFLFFQKQHFKVVDWGLIPAHKPQSKFVEPVTEEEHESIIKVLSSNDDRTLRNRLIIKMFHDTGIRKTELIELDVDRIDTKKMEGIVRTEKSRSTFVFRKIFWTKDTNNDLKKWLEIRSTYSTFKNFDPKPVFITIWANKGGTRISDGAIEEFIRRACIAANLTRTLHAHLWRHFFGNKLGFEGENNSTISSLMGHSDINSSKIYTDLHDDQKRKIYDKHFRR